MKISVLLLLLNFGSSFHMENLMPLFKSIRRYGAIRGAHKGHFKYTHKFNFLPLPEHFDARDRWPACSAIISHIHSQGENCGSCWAISVADAISDRLCIASAGRVQKRMSARHLMECVEKFRLNRIEKRKDACDVADPLVAWKHWKQQGIVTEKCKPYIEEIEKSNELECNRKCANHHSYQRDLNFGKECRLLPTSVREIQWELFLHGSVVAVFDTYPSIFDYSGIGIYKHEPKEKQYGAHAVRLIGWGRENKTDYWIALNSWGKDWGQVGAFRFARGTNECRIEQYVTAGLPDVMFLNKF